MERPLGLPKNPSGADHSVTRVICTEPKADRVEIGLNCDTFVIFKRSYHVPKEISRLLRVVGHLGTAERRLNPNDGYGARLKLVVPSENAQRVEERDCRLRFEFGHVVARLKKLGEKGSDLFHGGGWWDELSLAHGSTPLPSVPLFRTVGTGASKTGIL